jgi:hypothetical protein
MTFDQLAAQSVKRLNLSELGLAARFVQALDVSGSSEILEMSYLNEGRILVSVEGEGPAAKDAYRLAGELDGQRILGLPVRVVEEAPSPEANPSAMLLHVQLANSNKGTTVGRVLVRHNPLGRGWVSLGSPGFKSAEKTTELDAAELAGVLDSTLASTFVSTRVVRHNAGVTLVRIDNRLPFSIAHATVRTGRETNIGHVLLDGLGIAPGSSTTAPIAAPFGAVESVTLNGL